MRDDVIRPPARLTPVLLLVALLTSAGLWWGARLEAEQAAARVATRAQERAVERLADEAQHALRARPRQLSASAQLARAAQAKAATRDRAEASAGTDGARPPRKRGRRGRPRRRSRGKTDTEPTAPAPQPRAATPAPAPVPIEAPESPEAFLVRHPEVDGVRVERGDGAMVVVGSFPQGAFIAERDGVAVAASDPARLGEVRAVDLAPQSPLTLAALAAVLGLGLTGLGLRRRLLRLADISQQLSAGTFHDLPRVGGHDEVAWIAAHLHATAELLHEQVERVQGRNAHLVRDLTLKGDHIERLAAIAAELVAPVEEDAIFETAIDALARDMGAQIAVVVQPSPEEGIVATCTLGLDASHLRAPAVSAELEVLLERARGKDGPLRLPPLAPDHPWMRATGRHVPLDEVALLPLPFLGGLEGALVLAGREPWSEADMAFLHDVARPLAIALANRRAYRTQRALAARLAATNDTLLQQRDELEALNRLRAEFVANISHELRTPLGAILGYGELLHDELYGPINEEQRQALSGILETGRHLLQLVNQVLDLSRAEHEIRLRPGPADVVGVAREALRMSGHLASTRPYEPRLVAPASLHLDTDSEYLRQVVLNLVSNAIKFTLEGEVTVRVEALADGGARLSVADTGKGIAPGDLELVFEAFRQVDGSSTRSADGAGLGLAISRKIARALGGDLTVTSTAGVGSTFTLTLPARCPRPDSDLQLAKEAA